jgi:MFS family permease
MTEIFVTTRATHIWAVALTGAALFMITLDNLIVLATLPSMQRDLGVSIDRLQWVVDAYILAFAVFILTGAALGDRYGRRRMLVVGLLVFTASSAAGALSENLTQLVLAAASS